MKLQRTCPTCGYQWTAHRKEAPRYCSARCELLDTYDAGAEETWKSERRRKFTKEYLESLNK
jgi:endogenous inhibitor of DNA gyrase (YacG/DUF329 family)